MVFVLRTESPPRDPAERLQRLSAALKIQGKRFKVISERADLTERHARWLLDREQLDDRIRGAIVAELGEEAARFVLGV
jgi:hypothetical protein